MQKKAVLNRFCTLVVTGVMSSFSAYAQIEDDEEQDGLNDIDPNIERREIRDFNIDSENFEITLFSGLISIEDFGSDLVYGARLGYHINENFFIEASYAESEAGETSFETLSGGVPFLTDDQRQFRLYDLSAGYNFNGELFITKNLVLNTDFYVALGAGTTEFADDDRFTLSIGAGYRLLLTDYLALRFDVRNHAFNSDILGEDKTVHNLDFTIGISAFF